MAGIWLVSYVSLWLVVGFLLLAVYALARQVGLLHRRLPPTGARMLDAGPEIGERAPALDVADLDGQPLALGGTRGRRTLLTFVSPTCEVCQEIAPALQALWRLERRTLDVIVVSTTGDEATNRRFKAQHKLDDIPFAVAPELRPRYRISALPYALVIDAQDVVQAKGLVNRREHLDSLLRAMEVGYPSIEHLRAASGQDQTGESTHDTRLATPL